MKAPKPSFQQIKEFIELPTIAMVGVSADPKRFGYTAYKELQAKGWNIIPVNPKYETFEGKKCYPDLKSIPDEIPGVLSMVTKANTVEILQQAQELGIKKIWVQQMSETPEAVNFATENGMNVVFRKCILMFYPPVKSVHSFHRWMVKLFTTDKMP